MQRLSQTRDLGFQRDDAPVALTQRCGDVRGFQTPRDVLRTVGIPRRYLHENDPFDPRYVAHHFEARDESRIVLDDTGFPQILIRCRLA